MDPATDDEVQPEPSGTLYRNERDQAEQYKQGEEHPVQGLHHPDVRAEQWSNTGANTAKATDQAEKCRAKIDSPEHSGSCQAVRAEHWSRNAHTTRAADQAEQTEDVQQNTVEGEVAAHTLDCLKARAELCDNTAHTDCAGDQTRQSSLATNQPEHGRDCLMDRAELCSTSMDHANIHQVQYQAEQPCSPSVQQEADKTKTIRQPLTTPRAAAMSVVSPISIIIDPVLTSNSKGYFVTDDAMPVTSCVESVDHGGPEGCTRQAGSQDQAEQCAPNAENDPPNHTRREGRAEQQAKPQPCADQAEQTDTTNATPRQAEQCPSLGKTAVPGRVEQHHDLEWNRSRYWSELLELWERSDALICELITHMKEKPGEEFQKAGNTTRRVHEDWQKLSTTNHSCQQEVCIEDTENLRKIIGRNLRRLSPPTIPEEDHPANEEDRQKSPVERTDTEYLAWKEWKERTARDREDKEERLRKKEGKRRVLEPVQGVQQNPKRQPPEMARKEM